MINLKFMKSYLCTVCYIPEHSGPRALQFFALDWPQQFTDYCGLNYTRAARVGLT